MKQIFFIGNPLEDSAWAEIERLQREGHRVFVPTGVSDYTIHRMANTDVVHVWALDSGNDHAYIGMAAMFKFGNQGQNVNFKLVVRPGLDGTTIQELIKLWEIYSL